MFLSFFSFIDRNYTFEDRELKVLALKTAGFDATNNSINSFKFELIYEVGKIINMFMNI